MNPDKMLANSFIARASSRILSRGLVMTVLFAIALPAQAHSTGDTLSFFSGIIHPFHGLDHMLAMLAVGMWVAQPGASTLRKLPLIFALMLIVGASLGLAGVVVPLLEPVIAASVLILGLAIATRWRVSPVIAGLMIAGFAVFHGVAHGRVLADVVVLTSTGSLAAYFTGLGLATLALQSVGILLAYLIRQSSRQELTVASGISLATTGIVLLMNA